MINKQITGYHIQDTHSEVIEGKVQVEDRVSQQLNVWHFTDEVGLGTRT